MTTDSIILDSRHFGSAPVAVGDEYDITLRARVYRIEAERIDITSYGEASAGLTGITEGPVSVELTILRITVES